MKNTVWQIRINDELKQAFFEQAEEESRTASNLLEILMTDYLKKKGKTINMNKEKLNITSYTTYYNAAEGITTINIYVDGKLGYYYNYKDKTIVDASTNDVEDENIIKQINSFINNGATTLKDLEQELKEDMKN